MTLGTTTSFSTHNATNDGQSSGGNAGGRENRESKVSLAHGKRARKRNHRYLTSGRRPCRIECQAAIDERSNPSLETAHVHQEGRPAIGERRWRLAKSVDCFRCCPEGRSGGNCGGVLQCAGRAAPPRPA